MDRDIISRKLDSLARCVQRIETRRPASVEILAADIDLQDILSVNLERAVQLCVDMSAHVLADMEAAPPQTMGEVFLHARRNVHHSWKYRRSPPQGRGFPQSIRAFV